MQRVLSAAEMREADRVTIEDRGVPGLVLMENAAMAVVRELRRLVPGLGGEKVLVLCGKGNNGGDGLAIARQLLLLYPSLDLRTVVLSEHDRLSPDAAANLRMLSAQDHEADTVSTPERWAALLPEIAASSLVVDAILGTGLSSVARGLPAMAIHDVNTRIRHPRVMAVDMPSGLTSDAGSLLGPSMRADWTVTFTAPKSSQVLAPHCERTGELTVARIGTADSVIGSLPGPRLLLSEKADVAPYLSPRRPSSHKGTFGHVLAIGGSRSKWGAILMAGTSALRAGAGLVTVRTGSGAANEIVGSTPELMVEPAEELPDGTMGLDSFDPGLYRGKTVVALGPGLGNSDANRLLARRVCETCSLPLVIDADGLSAIAGPEALRRTAPTVLTPHPGEMARMTGLSSTLVQAGRLNVAREYAVKSGAVVVLKGNRTLIASPDGDVAINPTGTPGMATAGSGDILTGIVAAFLAQFPERPLLETVAAAVFLHGFAGQLAAAEFGEMGMTATDIPRFLKVAVEELRR